MRAAIDVTPAPNRLAGAWIGRDAFTGEATRATHAIRDPLVAESARYGFQATLRAPFRPKPARRQDHLKAWGYPVVRDEVRFHMTARGPLLEPTDDLRRDPEVRFAPVLGQPLPLDGLGLFVEPEPGVPFRVHNVHPFGSPAAHHRAGTP